MASFFVHKLGWMLVASLPLFSLVSGAIGCTGQLDEGEEDSEAIALTLDESQLASGSEMGAEPTATLVGGQSIFVMPTWTATGNLVTARARHKMVTLMNGKLLVTGGQGSAGILASAEVYDPSTGVWSTVAPMAAARQNHTLTLLGNGQVLAAGGDANGTYLASTEIYDPVANTWSTVSPMPAPRNLFTTTLLDNGKVLVTGGTTTGAAVLQSAAIYNPVTNTWSAAPNMNYARTAQEATVLPTGKVLITGGWQGSSSTNAVELYDPATNTFAVLSSMSYIRHRHTATLLPMGKVLIAGGLDAGSFPIMTGNTELYDPPTNLWSVKNNLPTYRQDHAATLLNDGTVLVTGGLSNGVSWAYVDLWLTASNVWTSVPLMGTARAFHTAARLANGNAIVVGGQTAPGSFTSTVEMYTTLGQACSNNAQCSSGYCVDGVCCDSACNAGACDACSVATGALINGTCRLLSGVACNDGNACTQTDSCQTGVC
ncbi:MAG TPA: kelch repeat-containing protein, partial [Polyangium sp.]|nr:kelch repeat-containing protein [Polyangium sp.]